MSINKNTTFVIWSFNFDWKVGGIYALHFLAKKLSDRGYRVFCIANNTIRDSNVKTVSKVYAAEMAKRDNVVVIYPEVVPGNPLMARNPVRWIMYYPGAHGSGDFVYAENECKVTYHDIFVEKTDYKGCPLLHIRDSNIKNFYDMNTQDRKMDVVLIKKGQLGSQSIQERSDKYLSPFASGLGISEITLFDEIIASSKSMQDLNVAFNKVRYFISFDIETYHSVLSAMAGCISVIVPTDSVTKEELFEKLPDWKYGIAYGLGDLEHASSTKHLLYEYAEKMEQENDESIDRLEKAIHDKFGL
jgi:hypothetical protein